MKGVDEITELLGRVHRNIPFMVVTRLPMLIERRDIPTPKRIRTTPTRLDSDLEEEEEPSEFPKNPGDMIIARHRDAIKRRRARGWCREEVKKVCNVNGEKVGKQLFIGKKNQLLNEYNLLKQRVILNERRKSGGIKEECLRRRRASRIHAR